MTFQRPQRPAAMAFILVTLFIDILGIGIVVPVLPGLIKEFAGSDSLAGRYVGIIAASYALMQFLCAPIVGAISDRFGRRPVLLATLFGLGIDYLIQGFAPSLTWLFAGRLIAGVMGASVTTANAYIADVSTPQTRARNFGLVGVMFGLGFICGPALGGLLGAIHLRLPFFVSAGFALLNWSYGLLVLPESLTPDKRSALSWEKVNPWNMLSRLRSYGLIAQLALPYACMSLAHRGLENVWVLYTGYRYGWNEQINGLALALVGLTAALVQGLLVRPTIDRLGEKRTVVLGLSISAVTFLGYGLANAGWMVPALIVVGSLGGISGPALQSLIAGSVGAAEQGKVQGTLASIVSLTNILAPVVFTAGLFSYFTSERALFALPGAPFLVGSLLLVAASVLVVRVFAAMPSEAAPRPPGNSP